MITFIVKGIAWQKRVEVDNSIFEKYEDMAFEAMTQALECFFNDDYEITDYDNFATLPWFLVAFQSGHEGNPDKTIVCLTEYALSNAGKQKIAQDCKKFRKEVQKNQRKNKE